MCVYACVCIILLSPEKSRFEELHHTSLSKQIRLVIFFFLSKTKLHTKVHTRSKRKTSSIQNTIKSTKTSENNEQLYYYGSLFYTHTNTRTYVNKLIQYYSSVYTYYLFSYMINVLKYT